IWSPEGHHLDLYTKIRSIIKPFWPIFLLTSVCWSQFSKDIDTTYRISFVDKIIVKANISTEKDTYSFRSSDDIFKLTTNDDLRMFLSLDYEFIGASIGFAPKFLAPNRDNSEKGRSSFTDYRFRFFLGNWVQGIQFKKTQGYHVDTRDLSIDGEENLDPYILFPNLKNRVWAMSTAYVFNPKFSLRNLIYQTEWQKKSAGSFIPSVFYDLSRFSNTEDGIASTEDMFNVRFSMGYYHTFVIHQKWFLSPSLSPSLGTRFSKFRTIENGEDVVEHDTYFLKFLEGGFQIGYSSKRIIFGGNFNFNINWHNEDDTKIKNDQLYGVLYFGYRFDAPEFVQKSFNWINQKAGF
ncbi:MAG: DUF4421 family protein, partial [Flavobacteriaceae bacterium]